MVIKKASATASISPPKAAENIREITLHGHTRCDEYAWLEKKDDPAVRTHIEAENAYANAFMAPAKKVRDTLYREIRSRIREDDRTVPVQLGPYQYYTKTVRGKQYPIHCRKIGANGSEEIILDENALARGSGFFSLGAFALRPDHRLLAYTTDRTGSEDHTLHIKDLETGDLLSEVIPSVSDCVWSKDGLYLFYTKEDHPHPPRKVYRHRLGENPSADVLVYEEHDPQWYVTISETRSRDYIFIYSANYTTTEARYIPAFEPLREPGLFAPRRPKVRYYVEHHNDYFYITTNERAVNYKIMRVSVHDHSRKWETWLPHDKRRAITGLAAFMAYMVLLVRENGSEEVYIVRGGTEEKVRLLEGEHTVTLFESLEYTSPYIRLSYDSFITPKTIFDYDVATRKFTVRKEQEVPRYDKTQYVSRREWVTSGSVKVPVVLVHKKGKGKKAPLLLEAYGSYGISNDPHFSVARLSLLERGVTIALAHPRGGGEMGWQWHKDAHVMTKHRTADDFIAVAEYLVKKNYTTRAKLAITGGSAGGMLMGMVLNRKPELFGAALVYVPAADLLTSLLDESLGGTRLHYDEIGDPRKRKQYFYILKQSPYENVRNTAYPPILVRASMFDVRTPYWEAAKWVARLRAKKTDSNPLLFKCEMAGGHFGKSGRYEWIKERAFDYAFLLDVLKKS
jgi:oligopeptidase B